MVISQNLLPKVGLQWKSSTLCKHNFVRCRYPPGISWHPTSVRKIPCAIVLLLHRHLGWTPRLHSSILVTPRCQIAAQWLLTKLTIIAGSLSLRNRHCRRMANNACLAELPRKLSQSSCLWWHERQSPKPPFRQHLVYYQLQSLVHCCVEPQIPPPWSCWGWL